MIWSGYSEDRKRKKVEWRVINSMGQGVNALWLWV